MPSPEQERARQERRTSNPATEPIDGVVSRLAADPVAGLSPKEAARRLSASEARPLFRKQSAGYGACLKRVIREPALWLMLAVALISLFFERVALGVFCLLLTAGNTALSAYFYRAAEKTDTAMQAAYDTPLCRVLRGGRILRISADGLVKGDIILLRRGDIVPADCRLLRTDGFIVTEREMDASDAHSEPVRLEKIAEAFPQSAAEYRTSPINMAFAGGMVEEGSATALVTAVGSETHLGGFLGYVPSPHQGKTVGYFQSASRVLSVYNLCLLFLVIPLTVLGIYTLGTRYEFLDIFLSALALATVTLSEHLLARGVNLATSARRAAALDRDGENTAEIKSAATFERLTRMTDLLLVGTAALHDGECHPESLRIGDTVYRCDRPEADEEARAAAEYLRLYSRGISTLPTAGGGEDPYVSLASAFCRWAEMDEAAFDVKVKSIRAERGGASGIFPEKSGNCRITVFLTEDFSEVESCDLIYDSRKSRPADREGVNRLYREYRNTARQGSTPLFLITEAHGERTYRAMLTYTAHICRKTAGCIKNLEKAGIRVTAFLPDVSDTYTRALAACGLTDEAPSDLPPPVGESRSPAAERISAGCRSFLGCTQDYVLDCIRDLQAEGRTVGVLSVDSDDVRLLAEADVAFTCSVPLFATAEEGVAHVDTRRSQASLAETDGGANGKMASDRSRRASHVVVRRSSAGGGGILGVSRALQAADGFKDSLDRSLRFVLVSQAVRAVMAILPLCLGLSPAAAPALLLSGVVLDALVIAAAGAFPLRNTPAPRRSLDKGLLRPYVTHKNTLIAAASGAGLPWIVAFIASLCDVEFGGDLIYFGLLCLLGLQITLFRLDKLPRRNSTVFFTTLGLALVYVGALAAALVAGLSPLWAIILPLTAPVSCVTVDLILRRTARSSQVKKP